MEENKDRTIEFCGSVELMNRYTGHETLLEDVPEISRKILMDALCAGDYSGRVVADADYVNGKTPFPNHDLVYDYQISVVIRSSDTNDMLRLWELPRAMRRVVIESAVPERPRKLSFSEVFDRASLESELKQKKPSKRVELIDAIERGKIKWDFNSESELRILKKCEDFEYDLIREKCTLNDGLDSARASAEHFVEAGRLSERDASELVFYANLANERDKERGWERKESEKKKRKSRGR